MARIGYQVEAGLSNPPDRINNSGAIDDRGLHRVEGVQIRVEHQVGRIAHMHAGRDQPLDQPVLGSLTRRRFAALAFRHRQLERLTHLLDPLAGVQLGAHRSIDLGQACDRCFERRVGRLQLGPGGGVPALYAARLHPMLLGGHQRRHPSL